MIRSITALAFTGLLVAACSQPEPTEETTAPTPPVEEVIEPEEEIEVVEPVETADSSLAGDCVVLASDPDAQSTFEEAGTDAEGFCACLVTYIDAQPDAEKAKMEMTLERVTDAMTATGKGSDAVVGEMMRDIMMGQDESSEDLGEGISLVGQALDDVTSGFVDTGSCAAG